MYERYNPEARRAIFFSAWEARQTGSCYIDPEHLLLGLTHDADSKANQLFSLVAHLEKFRQQLGHHAAAKISQSDLPLSNAGKCVLAYTAEEADRLASRPIGTEHLLLGLLREKKSDVPKALAEAGIDLHSARNRIRQDRNLPLLELEPEGEASSRLEYPKHEALAGEGACAPSNDRNHRKILRPFAAFMLLIMVLLLIYVIFSLLFP